VREEDKLINNFFSFSKNIGENVLFCRKEKSVFISNPAINEILLNNIYLRSKEKRG
jgi:hypothetical protein